MNVLAVFFGGGLGCLCRYGMSVFVMKQNWTHFPLATFLSNLLACIIMAGALYYFKDKLQSTYLMPLLITGFCGGFSTFSSMSYESAQLIQQGQHFWAILNIGISLFFGLGVFWIFRSS